jgi:hypothetical protein
MTNRSIRLPAWLTMGMVFQQGVPLHLVGDAQPYLSIRFEVIKDPTDGRKVSKLDTDYGIIYSDDTRADENGMFNFDLPACKASKDAYSFVFSSPNETLSFTDLRCGDVWLLLGSVPLSIPISKTTAPRTPFKDSALQMIRFFVGPRDGLREGEEISYMPKDALSGSSWISIRDAQALADATAVGFSLAYHLADQLHYPIGIIDLSVEGSAIHSWMSRMTIESDTDIISILSEKHMYVDETEWKRRFGKTGDDANAEEKSHAESASFSHKHEHNAENAHKTAEDALILINKNHAADPDGLTPPVAIETAAELDSPSDAVSNISTEITSAEHALISIGNTRIISETPILHAGKNSTPLTVIPRERLMTFLYNHKIAPMNNMNIRGIVFAPDQKDSCFTEQYQTLMHALLADLADVFGPKKITNRQNIPSLILLRVQPVYVEPQDPYRLAHFDEVISSIRRKIPMPIGVLCQHDLLLPDKTKTFVIGRRLSFIAMGLHFTPKMPTSSPECIGVEMVGNKAMLSFDNTNDGLKLADNESILRGFSICGEDRVYRPAQAKVLHGVRVMVWHDDILEPLGVTYGFSPIPHNATFRSRTELPVVPFRFDREASFFTPDLTFTHCDQLTFIGAEHPDSPFAMLPVYEVCRGIGKIFLETLNKTEGAGSLRIEYATDDGVFTVAAVLRYASLYAPLDISKFNKVKIDIFNPDQQAKELMIEGFEGSASIRSGLMWQTLELSYVESEPMKLSSFEMKFLDSQKKGSIYIDNIRFLQ